MPIKSYTEYKDDKNDPFDRDGMYQGFEYVDDNSLGHPVLECPNCGKKQTVMRRHLQNQMKVRCNCKK